MLAFAYLEVFLSRADDGKVTDFLMAQPNAAALFALVGPVESRLDAARLTDLAATSGELKPGLCMRRQRSPFFFNPVMSMD